MVELSLLLIIKLFFYALIGVSIINFALLIIICWLLHRH